MTYYIIILLALATYSLKCFAYPQTRISLNEIRKKHQFICVSLGCFILIVIIFLYFPLFFKYIALEFWKIPQTIKSNDTVEVVELTDLGSIGDIYGSLNTLFTSVTLIIVLYSAYLQREANKDARKSMTKQLQQVKCSAENQLALAKETHNAQMREIRKSNFDNKFYSLLDYKMQLFNSIKALNPTDGEINGAQIFDRINTFFTKKTLSDRYKTQQELDKLKGEYHVFLTHLNNGTPLTSIYSYLAIYDSLFILIDSVDYLDESEKKLYLQLIRNSCLNSEQITIFYISPMYWEIREIFQGKELFHSFDPRGYHIYARDHFDETYFFWAMHKELFT